MSKEFLPAYVMAYSDSSFTNPHEVASPEDPPDCAGNFTHMGAKYWGFETARHKATTVKTDHPGFHFDHSAHHWLKLGLKTPAMVHEIKVSTRWFTGNQVPAISITLYHDSKPVEVVDRTPLDPDSDHTFNIEPTLADECLVKCFHEGGIARINLMGEALAATARTNLLEDALISHVSNEHYGKPLDAVAGNRDVNYMIGWESARSGFGEQALFQLQQPAFIEEFVVDTYLHRLNAPLSCHVFGLPASHSLDIEQAMAQSPRWSITFADGEQRIPDSFQTYMKEEQYLKETVTDPTHFSIQLVNTQTDIWEPIISFARLYPDQYHRFRELESGKLMSHLLYMHYPNGGVHGLKAFGMTESAN